MCHGVTLISPPHLSAQKSSYEHKIAAAENYSKLGTMSKIPPSEPPHSSANRPGRQFKHLDPNDPIDNAFIMVSIELVYVILFLRIFSKKKSHDRCTPLSPSRPPQVTQYNIPPTDAWRMSKASGEISNLYHRLRRWHAEQQKKSSHSTEESECAHGLVTLSSSDSTPSSLSSSSTTTINNQDTRTMKRRQETMKELIPSWMDPEKTSDSMSKRPKRRPAEVAREEFNNRLDKHYYESRYKQAFKAATLKYEKVGSADNFQGKKGTGIRAIINEANCELLSSPNDMKLTRSAIHSAISRGEFGVSPPKRGRKPVVNPVLTLALATHSTMIPVVWRRRVVGNQYEGGGVRADVGY